MSEEKTLPDIEKAIQIQDKFNFYLVALTFSILGLSIQTAKLEASSINNIYEIFGWFSLFISGLCGLSRLEWIPRIYENFSYKKILEQEVIGFEKAILQGAKEIHIVYENKSCDPKEVVKSKRKLLKYCEQVTDRMQRRTKLKYKLHKILFVGGVFSLLLSRSYLYILDIVSKLIVKLYS